MSTSTNTKPRAVVHAVVPAPLLEQLRAVAKREDRTLSAELRRAVAAHVKSAQAGSGAGDE